MDQSKIRVITIDDHHVTRAGLKALLAAEPDIAVVGEGWVGDHLLERVRQHRPDVVLLDLKMKQSENDDETRFAALPTIRDLHQQYPEICFIVVSAYIDLTIVHGAFEKGVRGYVLKDDAYSLELGRAVRNAARGQLVLSQAIQQEIVRARRPDDAVNLTRRQREIILQLATDLNASRESHAEALGITVSTLENHLSNIYSVLGVANESACIFKCLAYGVISFESRYIGA